MKYYLNLYLENCRSRYTDRSFEIAKVHCSRIMYCLSEQGITEILEIAFSAIDMLIHADFHCSENTREMYLLHARFMLEFFASLNIIPAELSVMLDDRTSYFCFPHIFLLYIFFGFIMYFIFFVVLIIIIFKIFMETSYNFEHGKII